MFQEIKPKRKNRGYSGDKIRIAFPENKKTKKRYMVLYLGEDIAKKLGIAHHDKIKLHIDDVNPNAWWLKKSENGEGFNISDIYHEKSGSKKLFSIQIAWDRDVPEKFITESLFADWTIFKGGVAIFLPGITLEEKSEILNL